MGDQRKLEKKRKGRKKSQRIAVQGSVPLSQSFRSEIPKIFRVKWKLSFLKCRRRASFSVSNLHSYWQIKNGAVFCWASRSVNGRNGKLCKWDVNFRSNSLGRKKLEFCRSSSVCSGGFPFDLHVPLAFQPVEPKFLAKWKAPYVMPSSVQSIA